MIDRRPALIARCAGPDDVARTIAFARAHDLLLAVRGGGHNGGGLGVVDDGVVCDLSLLREVDVDPEARTASVGGGCTWADVDDATQPARAGRAVRDHLDDRRRRPDARRRARAPDPQVRPVDRQPARRRRRHGRRRAGAGERRREPGSLLGDPRRRRQLRRRDVVPFRANPVGTVVGRPDVLADRAGGRRCSAPTASSCPRRRAS